MYAATLIAMIAPVAVTKLSPPLALLGGPPACEKERQRKEAAVCRRHKERHDTSQVQLALTQSVAATKTTTETQARGADTEYRAKSILGQGTHQDHALYYKPNPPRPRRFLLA